MKKVLEFLIFILKWDIRISLIVFAVIMLWYFLRTIIEEVQTLERFVKF